MTWRVVTDREFDVAVKKLDRATAVRIIKALQGLADLDDPTQRCKALSGPLAGMWRRRVGDYRIILDIRRGELVIVALDVGHRSKIYD
jgi:mRNA interferase RelE/StbE